MVTSIDKAKEEVHTRIEAVDAYNERAWSETVDGIQEEAIVNKRHSVDLFEQVKRIKLEQNVVDKVCHVTKTDIVKAKHRIESLEVEATILQASLLQHKYSLHMPNNMARRARVCCVMRPTIFQMWRTFT